MRVLFRSENNTIGMTNARKSGNTFFENTFCLLKRKHQTTGCSVGSGSDSHVTEKLIEKL